MSAELRADRHRSGARRRRRCRPPIRSGCCRVRWSTGHAGHLERYGPRPAAVAGLIDEVEAAGLRGRGGAGFPTATKLRAVAGRAPASRSSWPTAPRASRPAPRTRCCSGARPTWCSTASSWRPTLLGRGRRLPVRRPQLARPSTPRWLERPERAPDRAPAAACRCVSAPDRYVAGEETALVHWLNGGEAKPTFVPPRPFERGVRGRPTLTSNVETYAQIGPHRPLRRRLVPGAGLGRRAGHHPAHRHRGRGPTRGVRGARGARRSRRGHRRRRRRRSTACRPCWWAATSAPGSRARPSAGSAWIPSSLSSVRRQPGLRRGGGAARRRLPAGRGGPGLAVAGRPERRAVRALRERPARRGRRRGCDRGRLAGRASRPGIAS